MPKEVTLFGISAILLNDLLKDLHVNVSWTAGQNI